MARTFLDECVDRRLGSQLTEHEVSSAYSRRWLGLPDSVLLNRCASQFDAFVTLDSNLEYQQNIRALPFGVIVLKAGRGRLSDLMALLPALNAAPPRALLPPWVDLHIIHDKVERLSHEYRTATTIVSLGARAIRPGRWPNACGRAGARRGTQRNAASPSWRGHPLRAGWKGGPVGRYGKAALLRR